MKQKMKRLFSLLLSFVLILGLMPTTALADASPNVVGSFDFVCDEEKFAYSDGQTVGDYLSDMATAGLAPAPDAEGWKLNQIMYVAAESAPGTALSPDTVLSASKSYILMVNVGITSHDYVLDRENTVPVSVNGFKGANQPLNTMADLRIPMKSQAFLNEIKVTVTEPTVDKAKTACVPTLTTEHMSIESYEWYYTGSGDDTSLRRTDFTSFEAGKNYMLSAIVKADTGYTFEGGKQVTTLNGIQVSNNNYIYYHVKMPNTGSKEYTLNVFNGNTTEMKWYAKDASVSLTAEDVTNMEFLRWEVSGNVSVSGDLTNKTITFSMPAGAASARAVYRRVSTQKVVNRFDFVCDEEKFVYSEGQTVGDYLDDMATAGLAPAPDAEGWKLNQIMYVAAESAPGTALSPDTVLSASKSYILMVNVGITSHDYVLERENTVPVSVNGVKGANQPLNTFANLRIPMKSQAFLREIKVTVSEPMAGKNKAAYVPVLTTAHMHLKTYEWYYTGSGDNTSFRKTDFDTFEAGNNYMLYAIVEADEGYTFEGGNQVTTLNGVQVSDSNSLSYNVKIELKQLTGRVQFTSAANVGQPIYKKMLDGTVTAADTAGVLHYQWQIKNGSSWVNLDDSYSNQKNYVPTSDQEGKELRIVITADGYEGSIISDAITVTKAFNPASPTTAPQLEARREGSSYTTMRVYTKAGQDYVWRDSQESNLKAIDWSVNAFTKPADADYVDITNLTEGTTYYVYTRISETETTKAGTGVKYSSLELKAPDYLQKVTLEGYTDYGDGNTIYIKKGETFTINVGKYPADATTWSNFTFGYPVSQCYTVTDGASAPSGSMPTTITLSGDSVGNGILQAYYYSGMYSYGSWKVVVYDTLTAGQITFTDKPAYDDITLYVGDSYTPTAPADGLLLPTEANDGRFEYRWYLYLNTDSFGSPYGKTTDNGYLSIDSETGEVTALSANCTDTHQPYVNLCLVDKTDSEQYQIVTSYKVTVVSNGEIPVDSVIVVPPTTTMAPGTSLTPTAVISPSNHTETGSVTWSKVSGSDSITIDPATGKVTVSGSAVDGETATIRATFGEKYGECVISVSTIKCSHKLTPVDAKPATCTEDGNTTYYVCSDCSKWYEDATGSVEITDYSGIVIKPLGHDWAAATCTAPKTCKRDGCGATEGAALGHDYAEEWSTNASKHWHECKRCGDKTELEAHDFDTDNICDTCGYKKSSSGSRDTSTGRWKQDEKGWWYSYSNGTWPSNGWAYLPWQGSYYWYYFNADGYMAVNWLDWNNNRYYLNPVAGTNTGMMMTGWRQIDGKWYFFNPEKGSLEGILLRNTTTPDGYQVGADGAWIQ